MGNRVCELHPGGVTASLDGDLIVTLEEDGEKFYLYRKEAAAFCRWYAGLDGDAKNPAPAKPPDPATEDDPPPGRTLTLNWGDRKAVVESDGSVMLRRDDHFIALDRDQIAAIYHDSQLMVTKYGGS